MENFSLFDLSSAGHPYILLFFSHILHKHINGPFARSSHLVNIGRACIRIRIAEQVLGMQTLADPGIFNAWQNVCPFTLLNSALANVGVVPVIVDSLVLISSIFRVLRDAASLDFHRHYRLHEHIIFLIPALHH